MVYCMSHFLYLSAETTIFCIVSALKFIVFWAFLLKSGAKTAFFDTFSAKGRQNPDEHFWTHFLDNPAKSSWAGQTFEQVCKDHIRYNNFR